MYKTFTHKGKTYNFAFIAVMGDIETRTKTNDETKKWYILPIKFMDGVEIYIGGPDKDRLQKDYIDKFRNR